MTFLEISAKVDDAADATHMQEAVGTALGALGLALDPDDDPKTRRVLTVLSHST